MNPQIIYLSCIVVIGLVLGRFIFYKIRSLQTERIDRLKRQKNPGSIPPVSENKNIQKQQIKRTEKRFSISRWTIVMTLLFIGLGLASIPFVKHISPSLIPVVMGVLSVIVGIAAKPFIENMICGQVLCYSKLARIGDTALVDDAYGVIEDVTLTHCIIKRWDSLRYVVPNSSMMTKEFVNYSLHDNDRWVIVEFWIDYASDMDEVEEAAIKTPLSSKYFSNKDEPKFWVIETDKSAVKCMITAWATSPAEGWMLGHDIRKQLVKTIQTRNIKTHTHRHESRFSPDEEPTSAPCPV